MVAGDAVGVVSSSLSLTDIVPLGFSQKVMVRRLELDNEGKMTANVSSYGGVETTSVGERARSTQSVR